MSIPARHAAALEVALEAGALARDFFSRREALIVEHKSPQNFVSRADRAVEALIAQRLAAAFPDDAFLGEESAATLPPSAERIWVVDPIDGTHNFLRGSRYHCISIAFVAQGRTEIGVVYDPEHDELFHARRGEGARRRHGNDEAVIQASNCSALSEAFVALGHHDRFPESRYLALSQALMDRGTATRKLGAGALQLAHVAAGRLDGFVELSLNAWDALAGLLLVAEAGGYVAPFPGPDGWGRPAPALGCAAGIAAELQGLAGAW